MITLRKEATNVVFSSLKKTIAGVNNNYISSLRLYCDLPVFDKSLQIEKKQAFRKINFKDSVRIYARGGAGGNGLPKYGGIGGVGGNVVITCDAKESKIKPDLNHVIRQRKNARFIAENGHHSSSRVLGGQRGEDLLIQSPIGVMIYSDDGERRLLGEINKFGDRVLVAKGGAGGYLSNGFIGQKGHINNIRIELQLLADIGFVGFPNAGKSTLMHALSRNKPQIGKYPFTTIRPTIGTVEYPDLRQITMTDLPGLIEGAHLNIGLGHRFLRHIERTKMLFIVADVHGFQYAEYYKSRSAVETVMLLNKEMELYNPNLLDKPAILVLNKIDVPGADEKAEELMKIFSNFKEHMAGYDESLQPSEKMIHFDDIIPISGKTKANVDHLKDRAREIMDVYAEKTLLENEELQNSKTLLDMQLSEKFEKSYLV